MIKTVIKSVYKIALTAIAYVIAVMIGGGTICGVADIEGR